jgi:hypothetical protein
MVAAWERLLGTHPQGVTTESIALLHLPRHMTLAAPCLQLVDTHTRGPPKHRPLHACRAEAMLQGAFPRRW